MIGWRNTIIGKIGIAEKNGAVNRLFFERMVPADESTGESALLQEAFDQLNAYLRGALRQFSLPLAPEGTPFQQLVWRQLGRIPYGQTVTYRELAVQIGRPEAVRAVGAANGRNPISIFIPCHRVIGSDGKLTGYLGGLPLKRQLLQLEAGRIPDFNSSL